jgi:hypothetical protein
MATVVALLLMSTGHVRAAQVKETTRLVISGPGIANPMVLTDESLLTLSNVFAGNFLNDVALNQPDPAWPRYEIRFDIQTREGIKRDAYVVTFVKSRWTGDTYIYLPGPGDARYRRNISTILREGKDGRWHHATRQWGEEISERLP